VLVAADQVARGKPHPEGYLAAAGRLGVDPSRCIAFEDAPAGVASATAAGARVVGITTSLPREHLGCDLSVADFRAITVRLSPALAGG
jgi:sugar-phosphatase